MATKISLALCVLGGLFLLSCIFLVYAALISNYNGNHHATHMIGGMVVVNSLSGMFLLIFGASFYDS